MMVDKEELIKQREIGQQIIIIRIVHGENDKVSRGGFSLNLDWNWAKMNIIY